MKIMPIYISVFYLIFNYKMVFGGGNQVLDLTRIENLKYAVNQCKHEEYHKVVRDLKKLPRKKLLQKNLIMVGMILTSHKIDRDEGDALLSLSMMRKGDVFNPIFRKGEMINIRCSSDENPYSFSASVAKVEKRSMVVSCSLSNQKFFDELRHARFQLEVAPDDGPFLAMLEAIESAEEVLKAKDAQPLQIAIENMPTRLEDDTHPEDDSYSNDNSSNETQPAPLKIKTNSRILEVMLGIRGVEDFPRAGYQKEIATIELNEEQKEAVDYALKHSVSVIHGPPGTGKSTTIVALAEQLLHLNERIVICGPSNVSVDTLLEKLAQLKLVKNNSDMLRLGSRHRMDTEIYNAYSISARLKRNKEACKLRQQIREYADDINGIENQESHYVTERRKKILDLQGELKNLEDELTEVYVKQCKILACTLQGITRVRNYVGSFGTLIIDEISQCLLPQCYIPSSLCTGCNRLVIAGDNRQLPPTVKSNDSLTQMILENTPFDVLLEHHGDYNRKFLTVQYRMSSKIMEYSNLNMYYGKLIAHESVANRRLVDNNWVALNPLSESPVVWIDTRSLKSKEHFSNFSRANSDEARIVRVTLKRLKALGVRMEDIAIISPYKFQIGVLGRELGKEFEDVEISSIDGFQGREKSVIILSMVRSGNGNMGFVADPKRMNVAITRARELLCIVGNSQTLSRSANTDGFLAGFTKWCLENAKIEKGSWKETTSKSLNP